MTTYTFREIKAGASVALKCPCGKRFRRSTTITNTVNPFNKNPETGQPRTPAEIQAKVSAEAAAWRPNDRARTCPACGQLAEVVPPKTAG